MNEEIRKGAINMSGNVIVIPKSSIEELTAQEMFEKLGYEYYNQDDEVIVVKECYRENSYIRQHINFNRVHKNIDVSILDTFLTIQELKAINQQCKELG